MICWFSVCVGLLCTASGAEDMLEKVEAQADAWVKTRLETARLEASWVSEQALLESTLAAMKERASVLEEKLEQTGLRTKQERTEIETLQGKIKATREDLEKLDQRSRALAGKLVAIRHRLPPRLSGGLEMAYRSLGSAELGSGERMQFATLILNRCTQFNRTITAGDEVVELQPGKPARSVQVIYWGLSHAYAFDSAKSEAWLGSPSESGWSWSPLPDAAAAVSNLVAIYADKADPEFVLAPAKVQHVNLNSP
jgi:Protein of unknown function (DUF3450)